MRTLDDLLIDAGAALDERCGEVELVAGQEASIDARSRWLAVTAAAALVAVSGVAFWVTRDDRSAEGVQSSPTSPIPEPSTESSSVAPGSTVPDSSAPGWTAPGSSVPESTAPGSSVPDAPSTSVSQTGISGPVARGSSGDDVRLVEQRLHDLGFFVGEIDGEFDDQTERAVWAWKKLVDGRSWREFADDRSKSTVTPETWLRMSDPIEFAPRRPSGDSSTHVEIYLPLQVLVVFTADEPVLIAHISSGEVDEAGNPITFCEVITFDTDANGQPVDPPMEQAICAESKTPGGVFQITRRYEEERSGPLGGMYRPQYFNYGIAIHGAENVPALPASHGTIRVTNAVADALWGILGTGDTVYVWGQDGREPESYTKAETLPIFNRPDPNATVSP